MLQQLYNIELIHNISPLSLWETGPGERVIVPQDCLRNLPPEKSFKTNSKQPPIINKHMNTKSPFSIKRLLSTPLSEGPGEARKPGEAIKRFSLSLILLICLLIPLSAQSSPISLALIPFENMNSQPDQDYLKGIIRALLEKDLSQSPGLQLVDRQHLEEVMKEQQLRYSGLMEEDGALEAGRLLGASFMLGGSYVFLGQDIFINLTLINVETGGTRSFSGRGFRENTVHTLAEELVQVITGTPLSFRTPGGDKSILALKQQDPGTVELYSPIIDARVFLDEDFAGYTSGDSTIPLILTVPPGRHVIRVHLSRDFGVIRSPEVTFSDWQEEFELKPGEKRTLEDQTRHFNSLLYDLQQVIREDLKLRVREGDTSQSAKETAFFLDREGNRVEITLSLLWEKETAGPEGKETGGKADIQLDYNGETHQYSYTIPAGEERDVKEIIGKVRLELSLNCRSEWSWELDYGIWRTDVYQGLHRE